MGKLAQNRPRKKDKKEKKVVVHRHNFEGGAQELLDRLTAFAKEWGEKHNALAEEVNKFRQVAVFSIARNEANIRIVAGAVEKIDTNVLAFSKVLRTLFGHIEQAEEILGVLLEKVNVESDSILTEEKIAEIKARAESSMKAAIASAFTEVQAEQKAHEEARQAAEALAKEQAAAAAKDKKEAESAEAEMRKAEAPQVDALSGGPGSDIPEGANVFGGG